VQGEAAEALGDDGIARADPEIPQGNGVDDIAEPGSLADGLQGAQMGEPEEPVAPPFIPIMEDIKIATDFVEALKAASLDNEDEPLEPDVLEQLRNPHKSILTIDNPDHRLSLDIFLSVSNASEDTYKSIREGILRRHPEDDILTYYKVKKLVRDLTGVAPIVHDMCINSCAGYTGPFANLENCPVCGTGRYDPGRAAKVPLKQFYTLPLGPQLQALWRTPEGADNMRYRQRFTEQITKEIAENGGLRTSPYRDFFDGSDYIEAVRTDKIKPDDMVLIFSIDGAQLYRNKVSDCWMYIWIILDLAPDRRYKKRHVLPGGFIPGKPKILDSYSFPGLHHVAALQKEGLRIWDAQSGETFISRPFLALESADSPAMATLSGCVGHSGKYGCRLYCPMAGRHKHGASHYYPARFKPTEYAVQGCSHDDIILSDLLLTIAQNPNDAAERYQKNLEIVCSSPNKAQFERRRLETGICKPTIFSGLPSGHRFPVPKGFALDIMHNPALNIPDLFIPLWRGTFDCDKSDNRADWPWAVLSDAATWKAHGKLVANATPYIPGSFDRPPRNPAEKISSGYKAWEFLLYFFGLGPALFYGLLPDVYWRNYCKCVRAFRILMQEEITPNELTEADERMTEFSDGFEQLYVQRRSSRLHFVRPSLHIASHFAFETTRIGPGIIYSQWAMERTIGNLGEEIKQHSNAFANLAERGIRRCQVNALKNLIPDLEPPENPLPRGAKDLGDGYALLRAMDNTSRQVREPEAKAIQVYLEGKGERVPCDNWNPFITRWARIRLPNGQIGRSKWKESLKAIDKVRSSRNIKVYCIHPRNLLNTKRVLIGVRFTV
jgi:hypothetical protein